MERGIIDEPSRCRSDSGINTRFFFPVHDLARINSSHVCHALCPPRGFGPHSPWCARPESAQNTALTSVAVVHLSFSPLQQDGTYLLVSSCKDGSPMLREWTGDWVGTFIGHKGAVWSTKLSNDTTMAATGSADFTACVARALPPLAALIQPAARSGIHSLESSCTRFRITTSSAPSPSRPYLLFFFFTSDSAPCAPPPVARPTSILPLPFPRARTRVRVLRVLRVACAGASCAG